MTVLRDHSGKLFTKQRPSIKDVVVNSEVGSGLLDKWSKIQEILLFHELLFLENLSKHFKTLAEKYPYIFYMIFSGLATFIYMSNKLERPEVVLAAVEGCQGRPRITPYTLQAGILKHYTRAGLYPQGVVEEIPACQDWALKTGIALSKLVTPILI